VGRRHERLRRGECRSGAAGRVEPRTCAGWPAREWHGYERQRRRLVRPGRAVTTGRRCSAGAAAWGIADARAQSVPDSDAITCPDGDTHADGIADDRSYSHAHAHTYAQADADPSTDTESDAEFDTDPDTESDAESDPDAHADAESDAESDAGPDPDDHLDRGRTRRG
jgi:hypothetical protein